MAIKGSISSASDVDYYKVDVGSTTTMDYDVLYNGTSQTNLLGISLYPFNFVTYDKNGVALMTYLFMAGTGTQDLDAGTSYVVFEFYGTSDYASGKYELDLQ